MVSARDHVMSAILDPDNSARLFRRGDLRLACSIFCAITIYFNDRRHPRPISIPPREITDTTMTTRRSNIEYSQATKNGALKIWVGNTIRWNGSNARRIKEALLQVANGGVNSKLNEQGCQLCYKVRVRILRVG